MIKIGCLFVNFTHPMTFKSFELFGALLDVVSFLFLEHNFQNKKR